MKLSVKGRYVLEHWRDGKRIGTYEFPNGITTEGKTSLLDIYFNAVTHITPWYLGLIDGVAGYSAVAATDTYHNIDQAGNGWDEFTDYTETYRQTWVVDAADAGSITNGTVAVFNINDTGTIAGVFCVGGITNAKNKNDYAAGGMLWATALVDTPIPVVSSDQLKITYTVTA